MLTIFNENNQNFLRLVSPHCALERRRSLSCVEDEIFNWEEEEIASDIPNTFSHPPLSSGLADNKSIVNLAMNWKGWPDLLLGSFKGRQE